MVVARYKSIRLGIAHQGDQSLTDYQGIAVLYFIVQCVTKTLANFSF
jgi:hypothetical protein